MTKYLIRGKFKMSAIFILKKNRQKTKFFMFLRGRYFVMGSHIDMNVHLFWESSMDFLKCMVFQPFSKYTQTYVNLNVKK